jgi:acetyl-CoA carboxylase biotin carboxyl carrier protein
VHTCGVAREVAVGRLRRREPRALYHRDRTSVLPGDFAECLLGGAARSAYTEAMALELLAPITGTIWEIKVKVGEQVSADQVLIVLESMKMEVPVEAPEAGKVAAVSVEKGQSVEEGDVLLLIET